MRNAGVSTVPLLRSIKSQTTKVVMIRRSEVQAPTLTEGARAGLLSNASYPLHRWGSVSLLTLYFATNTPIL